MIFQKENKNIQILTLTIDNVNIEQVREFYFLRLIIDIHLNKKNTLTNIKMLVLN